MDREKVIKAYECCHCSYDRKCEKCPYEKDCCHDGMPDFGIRDAIVLMKEQQEEITRLNNVIDIMRNQLQRAILGS